MGVLFSIVIFLIGAIFLPMGIVGGEEINILGQIISALVGIFLILIPLGTLAD